MIEVLIALVVLLVGVYAMFAIFPRGFSAMEATEARTVASQLADAELSRWKLDPESLPDQIVATNYDGTVIPGTLAGTSAADPTNSAASMLLVWNQNAMPLPLSTQYGFSPLTAVQFITLSQHPGALYSPGDLTPCAYDGVSASLPKGASQRPAQLHPNWEPDSLYLPRTVIGEQINILRLFNQPPSSQSGNQYSAVPFYLLSHAPLDVLKYLPGSGFNAQPTAVWMDIYDAAAWQYVPVGTTPLTSHQFIYDPSKQAFFFAAPSVAEQRHFKVDYTTLNVFGQSVQMYGLDVPTDPSGAAAPWPNGKPLPSNPATMQVHEALQPLTNTTTYAQAIQDPNRWPRDAYYIDPSSASVTGMIQFCPLLQTSPQQGDITLVKADYRVKDWQILVFDVEVPPGGTVQLPLAHLKGPTFTNPPRQSRPQEVAQNVRKFFNADGTTRTVSTTPAYNAYVVAVDRQNGEVLTDTEALAVGGSLSTNPYERRTRVRVDYRNGILLFNYSPREAAPGTWNATVDTPDRSGHTYRVFCRAEGDWGVQLQPAARIYKRASSSTGLDLGADGSAELTYSWAQKNAAGHDISKQLYFPLSESGQTVSVDYYKSDGTYVEGELHTIGGPQVVDLGEWVCPLSDSLANVPGPQPNPLGPINVRGISTRARVTWVGRGSRSTEDDLARFLSGRTPSLKESLQEGWYQTIVTTFIPRTPI